MPVYGKGRMWVVPVQQGFDHGPRGGKFRRFQPSFAVNRGISGSNKYPVALPQRYVQMLDQTQNHVATGRRTPDSRKLK